MKHKSIRINGHTLEGALLIDDPEVRRVVFDYTGQPRNIRCISSPGYLKGYMRKHPEGMIVAGYGVAFFSEPLLVSPGMVVFDQAGSAEILLRERADEVVRQLEMIEELSDIASGAFLKKTGDQVN